MMRNLAAVILAAGKGTRMKSNTPKVLHQVAGRPMLCYPVDLLRELKAKKVVAVVGHGAEAVKSAFASHGLEFALQEKQLGTGHAVMRALSRLKGFSGGVLILSGDVPLITKETVTGLLKAHAKAGPKAAVSLVTAEVENPAGYGRVVRDEDGEIARIVEEKDASPLQKKINEINTGIYLVSSGFLFKNIKRLGNKNAQGEYYLPDLVEMAAKAGLKAAAIVHPEPDEVMGVNNRVELAKANSLMRWRILNRLMLAGVTIVDPVTTYVDHGVKVGADTVIYPGTHLCSGTVIGAGCVIEEFVRIQGSIIGDGSVVKSHTVIESTEAGEGVSIGPFARLRPGNSIAGGVRIGNFVEVKKSTVGKGTKANHLSYIGDSVVGEGVNIGAGTITCNYDGVHKYRTTIEDGAFIGSDSQLIAPVRIGKNAYVGSGTTVTKDVPPGALVITRAAEKVVKDWVKRKFRK